MYSKSLLGFAASALLVLSACSQPEPVQPQPVYDKYGNAIGGECRPADQPVSPNYPSYLPVCETSCPPGQQSTASTAAGQLICVPIPRDDNDPDPQRPSPNAPGAGP